MDAPGRGEGEGGVASEISREKFLGTGDAGSGPSWSGWGGAPVGARNRAGASEEEREDREGPRDANTHDRPSREWRGVQSLLSIYMFLFVFSSVLKRPSCRHSQWRREGVAMREKPRPPVQVFAYDDTLGADEGRELESLLAYFPASAPVASKVRALSLARGIVGFASQFSIGSEGAEGADTAVRREDARVVRTKRGRLACLLATPSSRGSRTHGGGSRLWLCASLDDSIATSTAVRDGALVDALRILRDDHAMLHGDTSPPSSRNLSPLVADLGARLSPPTTGWVGMQSTHGGEKRLCGSALHALHSPLAPPTGCPLTSTSREVFLLTQSAVNAATLALDDWADDAKDDDNSDDDDVNDKDGDLVADTAVFHEGGMLWSSATVRATRAIARYAERCLVPGVAFGEGDGVGVTRTREADVAGASSRERGNEAGNSEAAEKVASTAARARALAAAVRAEAAAGISSLREARKRDGTDAGDGDGGDAAEEEKVDEVPVSASEWSVAPDGFLRRSSAAGEAVEASGRDVPAAAYLLRLHAPAAGARMISDDTSNDDPKSRDGSIYLLTLRVGSATLALSLRATRCPRLTDEDGWKALRRLCVDAAGPRLRELHESLALANSTGPSRRKKTLASIRGGSEPGTSLKASDHVPGYRYLYVDDATLAVRATPEAKLATVTFESLCAVQSVRREMEDEMSDNVGQRCSIDDSGSSSIHELCVRARNDVWVVGKRATAPGDKGGTSTYGARDRWLWVVLERAGDTLLDASAAVGAFCDAHFRRRIRRLVSDPLGQGTGQETVGRVFQSSWAGDT